MGGSVRIPSSLCGITGLKPSFGRIPFDILPSQFDSFCHFGPLARSVDDAALFLAAAQGPDEADISTHSSAIPHDSLIHLAEADPRGLRVALSIDLGYYAVDPEVEGNTRAAAGILREMGAHVDEVAIPWTRAINDAGWTHWAVYTALIVGDDFERYRDKMEPFVVDTIEYGRKVTGIELKQVEVVRTEAWKAIAPLFRDYDILLCPTTAVPAPPVGTTDPDWGHLDEQGRYVQFEMTFPFNMVSALPALSIPSGFTDEGLAHGLADRRPPARRALRPAAGQAPRAGARLCGRAAGSLTLARIDVPVLGDEPRNFRPVMLEMGCGPPPRVAGPRETPGTPLGRRTDRPWREAAAAIGTDVEKHPLDVIGAEGAFVAANPAPPPRPAAGPCRNTRNWVSARAYPLLKQAPSLRPGRNLDHRLALQHDQIAHRALAGELYR